MTIDDHDGTTGNNADTPTRAIARPVLGDQGSSLGPQRPSSMAVVEFVLPRAAALVINQGPDSGRKFLLKQQVTTVGRHHRSDVLLDDVIVSRRHTELRWANGELRVVDVGSLNGSYVNGPAVESTAPHRRRPAAIRQISTDIYDRVCFSRRRGSLASGASR
jgi:pSer/pThr/pTyr-binding forkhead associated (FHA) protein